MINIGKLPKMSQFKIVKKRQKGHEFHDFEALGFFIVGDPDPVGSGPFWSDPDFWDRIRILALIDDPISTFLVCVKAVNNLGISVA
jgi:hypothetical protein